MQSIPRPPVPKTVNPRRVGNAALPIIVHGDDHIFVERLGRILPSKDLPTVIATEPASIFVAHNAGIIVKQLDDVFDHVLDWQYRVSPIVREVWKPNRERMVKYTDSVISFFGFSGSKEKGKRRTASRYFYPLDPKVFINKTIFEIRGRRDEDGKTELEKLYEWACEVRDFLIENQMRITPTSGGIAAQLLRDSRFYPEPRRKVPKATNVRAREALPGNFYRLYEVTEGEFVNATYLDQTNAHHSAAANIEFPSSNSLFARGNFRRLSEGIYRPWLKRGSKAFGKFFADHRGLVLCRINVNRQGGTSFHLPCMDIPGYHTAFLFTNEIEYLESFRGCYVDCVYAAWTSTEIDRGLNKYAGWAIKQISESDPYRKNWLKPVLLSTYGILAAKPRQLEFGYKRAKSGEPKRYPVGPYPLEVIAKKTGKEIEMSIANVIHRGMVEAETRIRSLKLARDLHSTGIRVLAVYADSVFVQSDKPLPFLPEPWKIQSYLTSLHFFNSTSFTSRELEKLPGIPKEKQMMMAQSRSVVARANSPKRDSPPGNTREDYDRAFSSIANKGDNWIASLRRKSDSKSHAS